MKHLIGIANQYVRESDWKMIALLKMCLCAMGIMIGTQIPKEKRKVVFTGALILFFVTYVPLILKLAMVVKRNNCEL
ncbi:MAG: permease of phosphate ABC transporter [Lachnospiraceae bacterium]|nr:permease of phosphate ABC transporter [Lachnospiraceae bacterium]